MSLLASHLRALIVSNLRDDMNSRIKKAMMEVFNSIDQDLDSQNYSVETDTASSSTEEAVEKLENLLALFNLPEEEFTPRTEKIQEEEPKNESNDITKLKGGDDEPS